MQHFSLTNTSTPVSKSAPADKKRFSDAGLMPVRDVYRRKQVQIEVVPDPGTRLTAPLTDRELAAL